MSDDRMNRSLFEGRLSKRISVVWHDSGPNAGEIRDLEISLHTDLLTQSRVKLLAVLVHEMAHIATKNEAEPHGIRWRNLMYRVGLDPEWRQSPSRWAVRHVA